MSGGEHPEKDAFTPQTADAAAGAAEEYRRMFPPKRKKPLARTLEERIIWLWGTKGFKVTEIRCQPRDDGTMIWTVSAARKREAEK